MTFPSSETLGVDIGHGLADPEPVDRPWHGSSACPGLRQHLGSPTAVDREWASTFDRLMPDTQYATVFLGSTRAAL